MIRVRPILPFTIGALVFTAGAVRAQVVDRQLEAMVEIHGNNGYQRAQDDLRGSLRDDARETLTLRLEGGYEYRIHGVCDGDCEDMDLRLQDSNGNEVDSDILTDAQPIVDASPSGTATYRLEVIMHDCSVNPCYYGIGVYRRRAGSGGGGGGGGDTGGGWREVVNNQLNRAEELAEENGLRRMQENRTGSLGDDDRETLSIPLQGGTSYAIVGFCDQDCSDLDLRLRDPSGSEVDVDVEMDDTPTVEVSPSSSGTYSLEVIMVTCSTEPCFYGVGVYGIGGGGGGNTGKPTAVSTQQGAPIRGELRAGDQTISSGEYADAHYISLQAGQQVTVDLRSSEFDTYLILKKPSGGTTDNDDFEGSTSHSRVQQVADESGQWTIIVTSYSEGETGSYEVTTSIGAAQTVAAASGSGSGVRYESGTLSSSDQTLSTGEYGDVYTFQGRRGEDVVIDLRSSDFDPYLILGYPEEGQQDNDDHEGDASRSLIALTLPQDGRYRITVTSYRPGMTGSYDLRIEQGASAPVASGARTERGSLAAGDAQLRSGEYVDSYEFQGRPGQRVHLDLTSNDFDTYLILKDPNGEQQENDDFESTSRSVIDANITESGTYRVLVTSYGEGETGSYQLVMDIGARAASTTTTDVTATSTTSTRDVETLQFGQSVRGSLDAGDGRLEEGEYRDMYVFEGSAGDNIVVDMQSAEFDTYLGVVAPSGETEQNDDFEGSTSHSRIELTLSETGRYRVVATSYAAGRTGAYQLAIQRGGQAVARGQTGRQVQPVSGEGRVYGIFAGISDYGGRASNLAYTAEDAVRVQNAMLQGGHMQRENAVLLQDGQVTVGNIRNAIQDISTRIGPNDTFMFFYSGHGGRIPRDGPQSTDPDALDETLEFYDAGITDDDFGALLDGMNAGRILVFLDACFSGGFSKDVISVPGRMGMFSSEEDVTSSVAAKFRAGGYLAVFLADAIGDRLADADSDGSINAIELSQYIHERYRTDLKSGGPGDFVRTGGPQVGHQHLVVDRGSIGPREILFP